MSCWAGEGLIPAGAGRTSGSSMGVSSLGAHPRWRGADLDELLFAKAGWGSSPLARGGRGHDHVVPLGGGLIPAGAGRTPPVGVAGRAGWAHPRWRGADFSCWSATSATWGSSPLARGGPTGNARVRGSGRAHPRWRGADITTMPAEVAAAGSSPLARGGPLRALDARDLGRLIPAGAGRTA